MPYKAITLKSLGDFNHIFPHPLLYLKSIALSALQPFEIRGQMVLTRASPAADKVIFCSRKAEKVLWQRGFSSWWVPLGSNRESAVSTGYGFVVLWPDIHTAYNIHKRKKKKSNHSKSTCKFNDDRRQFNKHKWVQTWLKAKIMSILLPWS